MREPSFTLTAGPTGAWPSVQAAMGAPVVYDYDPVFLERFARTERKVAQLFRTSGDVVLMQGEAVLGLEAAARALVRPGMTALNLVSGVYAKWFGLWLAEYGAELIEVEVPYDEAVDPAAVARALADHPETSLVAVVHSETPSGVLNPLREIAEVVRAHGALMVADVVSSLGGEELDVDGWGLDLCVAGPQKCLAGPPGMSLVSVSDRAWEAIRANPAAPRGSFLSLLDWKDRWIDGGRTGFPYTPSVVDVAGVEAACDVVLGMGLDASIAHAPPRGPRDPGRRAGDGARALGPRSGLRRLLRDRRRSAGRRRHPRGAGPHPRALRGDALPRLRRAEGAPHPARPHGAGGRLAHPRRRARRRSAAGWRTSAWTCGSATGSRPPSRSWRPTTPRDAGPVRLPPFEIHTPATLDEAGALMERLGDDAVLYAGGRSSCS